MTLAAFKLQGGEVRAVCGKCRTAQKVDLDNLIRLNGAYAILRGRKGKCRVWACEGEATFEGRAVPGQSWVSMRRFTRLTNGFSKKVESHASAIALHFAYYNFVRIHQTLRMSPPMAAGVTDKLWNMADLVAVVEAAERPASKRGPYKKRVATPGL